jgi:hypothetical protein
MQTKLAVKNVRIVPRSLARIRGEFALSVLAHRSINGETRFDLQFQD